MQEALAAGHKFFLSSNQVLLCEGPLPVALVEELVGEEGVQQLPSSWQDVLSHKGKPKAGPHDKAGQQKKKEGQAQEQAQESEEQTQLKEDGSTAA